MPKPATALEDAMLDPLVAEVPSRASVGAAEPAHHRALAETCVLISEAFQYFWVPYIFGEHLSQNSAHFFLNFKDRGKQYYYY